MHLPLIPSSDSPTRSDRSRPAALVDGAGRALPRGVVVSETRLYREGLAWNLAQRQRLDIVATPDCADTALSAIEAWCPDVALVDVSLASGVQLVRSLAGAATRTHMIAVGIAEVERDVVTWAEAGVAGYVSRDASIDELLDTVDAVLRGECPCSPRVAATLLRRVAALSAHSALAATGDSLTQREREIGGLIARGLSNKQIAAALGIETATAKNHVHRVLEKLRVTRRGEVAERLRADRLSTNVAYGAVFPGSERLVPGL